MKTESREPAREILLSTKNPGKVREMRQALSVLDVRVTSAGDCPGVPAVDETADTLEGNARLKAEALLPFAVGAVLADDTGLEVTALDGRPGVYSARYAGPGSDDSRNRARLLHELDGCTDRSARFRTVLAFVDAADRLHLFEGTCEGEIASEELGEGGFGYDAIFRPAGLSRTFAQLSLPEKNAISHRGRALDVVVQFLTDHPEEVAWSR